MSGVENRLQNLKIRFGMFDLIPMSIEELRLNHYHNRRTNKILQLWFVDQSGNHHLFIESEIKSLHLDKLYPFYMKTNKGIKEINNFVKKNRINSDLS